MVLFIHAFLLVAFIGFLLSLLVPRSGEQTIMRIAAYTTGINTLLSLLAVGWWLWQGGHPVNIQEASIYQSAHFNLFVDFYFDRISATFLVVGNLISFMVVEYSRYYLHKESGYKRFFNTILFFYAGYLITALAGNFETLFVGWEILGLSSFLLIGFYRLRYLPVKNAFKVFTIYRIGDVGILLAMWMSHHLWEQNITFLQLENQTWVREHLATHSAAGLFVAIMLLVAAAAKSAQLPFSTWLPRAMEGPTVSSAIFYGALSVHMGAFLLMRTAPFWEQQIIARWLIALLGLSTAVVSSLIAQVQSTPKGQIAYSSSAQIGLIFVEIALGLEVLALVHFVGNAFLRSYQLLVSPSVVAYLIREQFYTPPTVHSALAKAPTSWLERFRVATYIWSLKEWNLEKILFFIVLRPLKQLRGLLSFLTIRSIFWVLVPLYLLGVGLAYMGLPMGAQTKGVLAVLAAFMAFLLVAKAYNERSSSRLAWLLILFAHFFVDLAVTLNDHLDVKEATIYLSGIVLSGILGYYCLQQVRGFRRDGVGLNQFHGLVEQYPVYAFLFLLASLGLAGFPITTTFLGEDLILTHIHAEQFLLAFLVSITFVVNGLAVIRIYARVFLGRHRSNYQTATDLTI